MNSHIAVGNEVFIGAAVSPVRATITKVGEGEWASWVTVERAGGARDLELREYIFPTYQAAYDALRARGW